MKINVIRTCWKGEAMLRMGDGDDVMRDRSAGENAGLAERLMLNIRS